MWSDGVQFLLLYGSVWMLITCLACAKAVLVTEVLQVAKSYGVVIDRATELIAKLDVVTSLAHVAVNAPVEYARPTMLPMGEGDVDVKAARHPCMEWHENVRSIPLAFE